MRGNTLPRTGRRDYCPRPLCDERVLNNPDATAKTVKNGFLYTGDIGKMDEDGYVYLLDRKKDVIISGGYNIYPKELENVLYEHPSVLEAAVIGVPDERLGEVPKAYVVRKEGYRVTASELKQFALERLASYKQIRSIEFIAEIPKTPTGKLMKRKLVEMEKQKRNVKR